MGDGDIEDLKRSLLESSVRPMQEALDAEKITYRYLAKKLKRELNAKTTKWFQHEGKVKEVYDIIDWGTRQRARIDAQKIMGVYAPEKHDLTINTPPTLTEEERVLYKELARKHAEMVIKNGDG